MQSPGFSNGSAVSVLRSLLVREGLFGMWKGVGPAMGRASVLTAAQCATYDESKQVPTL